MFRKWVCVTSTPLVLLLIFMFFRAPAAEAGLVYSALENGSWRIYLQEGVRSRPRRLDRTSTGDANGPMLSPGRNRVAFYVEGRGIQVCSFRPSSCRRIENPGGAAVRPVWHSTSRELIFVVHSVREGQEDSDFLITTGGLDTAVPLLTQTGDQNDPSVSHDGRLLAYSSAHTIALHRGAFRVIQQLWVMNLQTGVAQQLILSNSRDNHPDWSPDGKQIAFASDRTGQFEIWIVDSDGRNQSQVTSGAGGKTWPAWSPDGKSIMYTLAKDGRQSLWIIDVDGSNLRPFQPFGPDSDIQLRDADWR